jgi:hypothetical protein
VSRAVLQYQKSRSVREDFLGCYVNESLSNRSVRCGIIDDRSH